MSIKKILLLGVFIELLFGGPVFGLDSVQIGFETEVDQAVHIGHTQGVISTAVGQQYKDFFKAGYEQLMGYCEKGEIDSKIKKNIANILDAMQLLKDKGIDITRLLNEYTGPVLTEANRRYVKRTGKNQPTLIKYIGG